MLPRPMRAVAVMSYLCPQGHVYMCWNPQTEAGGCAGTVVCVSMYGGAVAGPAWRDGNIGKSLTKPCFSCRYNGRTGLLPAVLLQPEGLGSLLGRPGLPDSGGADKVAEDKTVPPVVPTRPCMSAIQSRCCSITRRALGLGQEQGTQVPS